MATKDEAVISVGLEGGSGVVAEVGKIDSAFAKVKGNLKDGLGSAIKGIGSGLASAASDGLRAAGVFQAINLANAVEDAKKLDFQTAQLGITAGITGAKLREGFEGLEKTTLQSAPALAAFATSLSDTTFDAKSATEAVGGLADVALATGQDLNALGGLGKSLHDGLGVIGDTTAELGRLRDIAEQVKIIGGPKAFYAEIASLGPQLETVSTATDQSKARLEALVGVLSKGLTPGKAREVVAGALSTIKSSAADIKRNTGRDVLDSQGQIIDPTQSLQDLQDLARRKSGGNAEKARRLLSNQFGSDVGTVIERSNFGEVSSLAANSRDQGRTTSEADAFRQTDEAKRKQAELERNSGLRGVGNKILDFGSSVRSTLGDTGSLVAAYLGKGLLPTLGRGASFVGRTALSGAEAAGAGTLATAAAVSATFAAPVAAVLNEIGENTDVTGDKYRRQQPQIVGEGLANKAIREGDITGAIAASGGDIATQKAILEVLQRQEASSRQLNETLRGQADALAQALGQTTLTVQQRPDPTEARGGT